LDRRETLAIVGESGAGKSTLGRLILRLIEPDAGAVSLDGIDVRSLGRRPLRAMRRRMQMIFQDPFSSLDPRMVVEDAVGEPLTVHFGIKGVERRRRVLELLDRVGIDQAQAQRYPHEFSGGQLQRIATARALAVEPDLIVCDEPVAALDVSIRSQIINLLNDIQKERGVAYLFISHDLSLVRLIADRIAVMYRGQVVEEAQPNQLFTNPRHPYTRALIDVIPVPDPRRRPERTERYTRLQPVEEAPLSTGCSYAPRCALAMDVCWSRPPQLRVTGDGRRVSCHLEAPQAEAIGEPPPVRPGSTQLDDSLLSGANPSRSRNRNSPRSWARFTS
jgi:oligopeptide/dipeptide ABC transporter ATP-binding protein